MKGLDLKQFIHVHRNTRVDKFHIMLDMHMLGNLEKREYSFIPNISLTGSIDRNKIGCINERFMASLQNNVKTEIPQESQIMMKEAVIDLRFKRVRYATSKIMVRTQSKFSIDIFIGQLDNILPEYVVDLNQF